MFSSTVSCTLVGRPKHVALLSHSSVDTILYRISTPNLSGSAIFCVRTMEAGMMAMEGLPMKTQPHDAMRLGLASLKEDALATHPVEQIQREHNLHASSKQLEMMRQVYGTSVPARLEIETQILSRFTRLPGLPSSMLGLESMTGELDGFSFESYLGLSSSSDVQPPDLHSIMEQKLNMGTKVVTRGMF